MPRSKKAFQKMQDVSRQKILLAALEVFVSKGVHAAISEIAKAAGVSKGLIYHYFDSKEALIIALLDMGAAGSMTAVQECAKLSSAAEAIQATSSMMATALSQDNITNRFFFLNVQLSTAGMSKEIQEKLAEMQAPANLFAGLIEKAQQEGTAKEGDAYELSLLYWAAVSGMCCYILSGVPLHVNPQFLSGIVLKQGG